MMLMMLMLLVLHVLCQDGKCRHTFGEMPCDFQGPSLRFPIPKQAGDSRWFLCQISLKVVPPVSLFGMQNAEFPARSTVASRCVKMCQDVSRSKLFIILPGRLSPYYTPLNLRMHLKVIVLSHHVIIRIISYLNPCPSHSFLSICVNIIPSWPQTVANL